MMTSRSNPLVKLGVPTVLPNQFGIAGKRILVMDGDAACYQVASAFKTLDTALRHFKMKILEAMFLTQCSTARVHVTPKGCLKAGRHLIVGAKPYQGNRQTSRKPPLLESLREQVHTVSDDTVTVFKHYDLEADDYVMIDACSLKHNCVVWSEDKDLRIVPSPYYEISTGVLDTIVDRYGWLSMGSTEHCAKKIKGHGTKFFWAQMLMGDTADNVQGILSVGGKKCGQVLAYKTLQDINTEDDACNLVIGLYRDIDQNPLPEGELLWLRRNIVDSFATYLSELKLSAPNKEFIDDCTNRVYIRNQNEQDT